MMQHTVRHATRTALQGGPAAMLTFTRSYRAEQKHVRACFNDAELVAWCQGVRTISDGHLLLEEVTHLGPVHVAVELQVQGALIAVVLAVHFGDPVLRDAQLESGYADRWEERLYRMADHLQTPNP